MCQPNPRESCLAMSAPTPFPEKGQTLLYLELLQQSDNPGSDGKSFSITGINQFRQLFRTRLKFAPPTAANFHAGGLFRAYCEQRCYCTKTFHIPECLNKKLLFLRSLFFLQS